MDGAKIGHGKGDVTRDGAVVGAAMFLTSGGGALAGEAAEAAIDHGNLAEKISGFVIESVGGFHDVDPHRQGEHGAISAMKRALGAVEADPYRAGDGGGVAGEPCVFEIVGCAGFASAWLIEAEALDGCGGAAGGDLVEDFGHRPCRAFTGSVVG